MEERTLPSLLLKNESFSRREYADVMASTYHMTNPQISYDLQKRLDRGELIRSGWGIYSKANDKRQYHYNYQKTAECIAEKISSEYVDVDFRIFELVQLNEFINHLIGRNVLIVYVENELADLIFNTLVEAYPGKVMFKPGADDFYRYFQDGQIVVCRLISEAPKGFDRSWNIRLEQIIVDIYADRFVSRIVAEEEKARVVENAFKSYIIDDNTLLRYARRRGAEQKIKPIIARFRKGRAV